MAKVIREMVNGVAMTAKEKAVYEAIANAGSAVKAADIAESVKAHCSTVASVRSTMARLNRVHGVVKSTVVLNGNSTVLAYEVK